MCISPYKESFGSVAMDSKSETLLQMPGSKN